MKTCEFQFSFITPETAGVCALQLSGRELNIDVYHRRKWFYSASVSCKWRKQRPDSHVIAEFMPLQL